MAGIEEDDHDVWRGGMEPTPEQIAAIHAAMMVCYITPFTLQPDNSLNISWTLALDCTFAET
jgi:hypothetical protein